MASPWNIWQIGVLQVDISCSKNCPTRGCLLVLSPDVCFSAAQLFFYPSAFSWQVAQGDISLYLAIDTESNYFGTLSLLPSAFPSLVWSFSLSLSCVLALTPEPFTWASSPVPEQIEFDTAASQLQFNLRSLLCRGPSEAPIGKHVDERSEDF